MKSNKLNSVGLVKTQTFTFADKTPMPLESGETLGPITLAYETYGELNKEKSNAILVTHALSGDAHAAGYHSEKDKHPGWWDRLIGPGKPLNTDNYFIVCSNVIGGCMGSTGPLSLNPATGIPYGLDFPVITINDMVNAQIHLMDYLKIPRWLSVIGGSMGGMQAMLWSILYPDKVKSIVPLASTSRLNVQAIAFDIVGRQAIYSDPQWIQGGYQGHDTHPSEGLAVARMLAHITYLSEVSMLEKFGRDLLEIEKYGKDFATNFQVESYLKYQGESFIQRFDANSYLYITKAIDYFDLVRDFGSLENAFRHVTANMMILSFSSDWLFPTCQAKEIVRALQNNEKEVTFCEISSPYGHDAFLLPDPLMEKMITDFIHHIYLKETA